jgi:hypothetical protein
MENLIKACNAIKNAIAKDVAPMNPRRALQSHISTTLPSGLLIDLIDYLEAYEQEQRELAGQNTLIVESQSSPISR